MVKALFDSCILIDYLNGSEEARAELARYDRGLISVISWMEVMAGAAGHVEPGTRRFLTRFDLVEISQTVAERAVQMRQRHRLRLPDAIIWASADVSGALLVTRNTKDFPSDDPGVRIPYRI